MTTANKIRSFMDLQAWKVGHDLALQIYKVTRDFPKEESFGLTSQMTRAAVSVTSNIAEGFSRWSKNDKIRFFQIALGSVTELQNQLLIARDVGYVTFDVFSRITGDTVQVHKLITGLIKHLRGGRDT